MDIARTLTQLGLQETEARFYLAALELGEAPMREVAAKAGIGRTNAYDVFSRLSDQGLVVEVSDGKAVGKGILVAAEPPEQLYAMFEERRRRLERVMPELESRHARARAQPRVRHFRGLGGIKTVLEDTLTCRSKELLGILSMRDLYEVPGRAWMDDLVRRRIEAGVQLRAIRSPSNDVHPHWPESAAELRRLRFAPSELAFAMTTYIYDEKVAIISSQREHFAMTIESAELARLQTSMFEALWSQCKPSHSRRRTRADAP
ncbi:MAG: transcriptional regulator TrmB [Hyphomicrobiales bacterium]|nr:transcriptional regulator TrmB [Hyphomicrobiales bacterium]